MHSEVTKDHVQASCTKSSKAESKRTAVIHNPSKIYGQNFYLFSPADDLFGLFTSDKITHTQAYSHC